MDEPNLRNRMDKVVELFVEDIGVIRTGRASPALIEGIVVSVYEGGQPMKLAELGTISVEGARSLLFVPWDKSVIKEIKNQILKDAAGYSPVIDNDKIRITLPLLTTEQREDYVKLLNKKLEASKIMIRDLRGRERRQIQEQLKEKALGEDESHLLEEKLQKITDEYVAKLEELVSLKEKEIRGE